MQNTQAEKDLLNTLDSSTKFLQTILEKGYLSNDPMLLLVLPSQIESNKLTINTYNKDTLKVG